MEKLKLHMDINGNLYSCELDLEVQSIGLIANKLGRGDT